MGGEPKHNAAGGAERERYGTGLKCPVCGFVGALKPCPSTDHFPERVVLGEGYVRLGGYSVELHGNPFGVPEFKIVKIDNEWRERLNVPDAPRYRVVLERVTP